MYTDQLVTLESAAVATASYTGKCYLLNGVYQYSIQVSFSDAGLAGTIVVQGSNDPLVLTAPTTAAWVSLATATSITAGEGFMWTKSDGNYKAIRILWTRSAGTGTLTAWLELKTEIN